MLVELKLVIQSLFVEWLAAFPISSVTASSAQRNIKATPVLWSKEKECFISCTKYVLTQIFCRLLRVFCCFYLFILLVKQMSLVVLLFVFEIGLCSCLT